VTRVASQLFSWKRFWFPREAAANFDFEGYLLDPEDEYWRELQSELVDFESIASKSCLVLLGEPGIGKSEAIREQLNLQAEQLRGSPDKLLHIDLRSYGSEDRLCRELFEDKDFTEWANGTHRLYLFLDSLDECLLQIKTVVAILSDKLPHYPTERLNLRIACRAAEWPNMLEEVLGKLYSASDSNFGIYQLAPLRRVDVEEASSSSGIDPPAFLDAIRQVSAVPFAIKPVTLKFLLNTFAAENRLPQSQLELYEKGCRLLCEETNASRRTSGNVGQFTTNQRFVVAGRICHDAGQP